MNKAITHWKIKNKHSFRISFLGFQVLAVTWLLPVITPVISCAQIIIHIDKSGIPVSPTLYGAFFEDINRSGDGGLYAEMIQNRSFEDHPTPISWTLLENPTAQAAITIDKTSPIYSHNPSSLKIQIDKISSGRIGIFNQGFKGIPSDKSPSLSPEWLKKFQSAQLGKDNGLYVQANKTYLFSLYAKQQNFSGPITITLETQNGIQIARQTISGISKAWKKFEINLIPDISETDTRLVISAQTPGTIWLDMVSLFPMDTYKGRKNGLRDDMVKMMAAMHPGLLRFPGGSFSEGHVLADAWKWKKTIGDIDDREGNWNIWGYRSTSGLGFHEYLQLAEDLGAEPLYVAHVGMAEVGFVPMDQIEPWIQDVLDAIEYANGPVTSKWGALRAKNGHPIPFNLKYIEIGNENGMGYWWGGGKREDYLPRYKAFYERIKTRYPEITTIANIHTMPDVPADIVDEHYYNSSAWFFKAAHQYDTYDRKKPKLYIGEYACQKDAGNGNLLAALAEAAFLTGLERNSDVVVMSSYAPLFTNPQWQKWKPNAIVFNNHTIYGTPSYYVQSMFAANRTDVTVPIELPVCNTTIPTFFAVAGFRNAMGELILKVVNSSDKPESQNIRITGQNLVITNGICLELSSDSLKDENSFNNPEKISPRVSTIPNANHTFPPYSVTIIKWKISR